MAHSVHFLIVYNKLSNTRSRASSGLIVESSLSPYTHVFRHRPLYTSCIISTAGDRTRVKLLCSSTHELRILRQLSYWK